MRKMIAVFALLLLCVVLVLLIVPLPSPPKRNQWQTNEQASNALALKNTKVKSASASAERTAAENKTALTASSPNAVTENTVAVDVRQRNLTSSISYAPEFTNFPPETVMENMRTVFHSYASMFGGNPVGTNPEITAALDGNNRKQAHFLNAEDGQRLNSRGELIDPWGTPYFFHQLSGTEMEIHSAGPDKVMWTADDLVIK